MHQRLKRLIKKMVKIRNRVIHTREDVLKFHASVKEKINFKKARRSLKETGKGR